MTWPIKEAIAFFQKALFKGGNSNSPLTGLIHDWRQGSNFGPLSPRRGALAKTAKRADFTVSPCQIGLSQKILDLVTRCLHRYSDDSPGVEG